ncbi:MULTISPECIES: rho operon leader peptide [Citrobacter]|uniref:Rho operon leader peptide n=1 Tax=Citrobacter sedlakii TaxID=67826 RepID=A0ABS0ZXK1_9ENTR|nr:rho operon leader peptide [Citrobacter sedlakii]QMK48357.1 rho operon leader peptide [Citrobacter sp. RHB21-C05]QMK66800.1 rho operon leader peptide [Citrobacter sp. RHB21-C01]EHG7614357.1 rho operon leader peptide [Citrobacter sedlakii]EIQ7160145.1 rho operon leader peptide [Citrobacter sedlakii]
MSTTSQFHPRCGQIPGLSFIPSCRFSSAYFPVTRQRTDMS